MKKRSIVLIMLLILLMPLTVKSASVYTSKVTGLSSVKIGEEFSENFYIRFDGVNQNDENSLGVAVVSFEIIFDDSILTITGVSSNGWATQIFQDENTKKYYALSTIEGHPDFVCTDGILNCGRYEITIEFLLKSTTKEKTTIAMGEIEAGLLPQIFDEKDISLDNVILVSGKGENSHTITIKNNEKVETTSEKTSIVENSTKKDIKQQVTNSTEKKITSNNSTNSNSTTNNQTTNSDKRNNHLKSLLIEGYEINFDKYKNILREKRELLGLTQKQVADRANVKIVQYQRFEMGMRNIMSASFQIACRIIEALEMDITDFYHNNNAKL